MRKSNFELLRLISMFFVLVLHANYLSIDAPIYMEVSAPEFAIRHFIESFTFIAVDVFILISGYFSIRPSIKSVSNLLFSCFFYSIGIRVVYLLVCWSISKEVPNNLENPFLFISNSVWFVADYLMLVVFAPILNAFIDHTPKKTSITTVAFMIIFAVYFGMVRSSLIEYISGFSFITFIIIYLIGRILHQNQDWIKKHIKNSYIFGGYLLGLFAYYGAVVVRSMMGHECYLEHLGECLLFSYTNPILILTAVCFFWLFAQKEFYSTKINTLAKSTFAILLIHTNSEVMDLYNEFFMYAHEHFTFGTYITVMLCACIFVFWASILIDQIRIFIYDRWVKPIIMKVTEAIGSLQLNRSKY